MSVDAQPTPSPKWMIWAGWILTLLSAAALLMSAVMKFMKPPEVTEGVGKLGWDESLLFGLGVVEAACALAYLLPRTAVLGAILVTGYLGGAVATHVRVFDPYFSPIILGVLVWLGLYFRDERVRALVPLRSATGRSSWLTRIGLSIVAIVVIVVVHAQFQAPRFHVERSITIDAPPAEVFAHVNDFHKWDAWSPWAKLDPDVKYAYGDPAAGKGATLKWDGNSDVGEGMMTMTESVPHERIKIRLDFIRPFPDTGNVEFAFKADGKQTVVTWTMHGEHNPVSKIMCLVMDMDTMIGRDFEKGLASMKAVVEASRK